MFLRTPSSTPPRAAVSRCAAKFSRSKSELNFETLALAFTQSTSPGCLSDFIVSMSRAARTRTAQVWDCRLPEPTYSHAPAKFPLPANRASAPLSLCCFQYWMSVNLKPNSHSMGPWRRLVFETSLRRSGIFTQNCVESRKADRRTCPLTPDSGRSTMQSCLQDPPALTVSRGNPEQSKEWSNGF